MDQTLVNNYLEYLPANKSAAILDYGCGSGRVLRFLKDLGYTNFLGIDRDQTVIDSIDPDLRPHAKHVADPDNYLTQYQDYYDLIILKDVIYYYRRDQLPSFALLISNSLKKKGTAIVEVFNGALLTANYTAFKDLGILTVLTESSLRQFLDYAKLNVLTVFEQKQKLSFKFRLLQGFWIAFLKIAYALERGLDSNNPKLWSKSIIGIGQKK